MAQIVWTSEALRWLEDIFEYIAADNPDAASRTVEGIYERAQVLAQYPEMGHSYLHSTRNVRILLFEHHRIAYFFLGGTPVAHRGEYAREANTRYSPRAS